MSNITLNRAQRQAVRHSQGPLLIIAGAGTGKTTVITERIKYLIQKKTVDPQHVFAATFTEKSAAEMLERLDLVMPLGYQEPWLGTFHGLCDRILHDEALEIGLDPNYKIITPVDQWILIKKHLFNLNLKYFLPLGNPSKFISALIKFFSRAGDEDVTPQELSAFAKKSLKKASNEIEHEGALRLIELAQAFSAYQQMKIKESALDFTDLISQTLYLFRKRPSLLLKYRQQFQHILIDEFQDTNYAQYQLIKLLAPSSANPNLIVVGDDDQSIYKFRGAAVSNILEFKNDYPLTKELVLTENYRSLKPILAASYRLIRNNDPDRLETKLKISKKLKPHRKNQRPQPLIIETSTAEEEVNFTVKTIHQLIGKHHYTYKDFAVLTRANAHLDAFVSGFKSVSLPYQLISNHGLFDQEEIRQLLLFLTVVANPEDSRALFYTLQLPSFNLSFSDLISWLNLAKLKQVSLWTILQEQSNPAVTGFLRLITEAQKQSLTQPASRILYNFIFTTGFMKNLAQEETIETELKIKNLNLLFERIKRFEMEDKTARLPEFIEALHAWQEAGDNPAQAVVEDVDAISLLTIHSAKGLEFPVVFIPSLIAGRFPSIARKDQIEFPYQLIKETLPEGNELIQEERRLLYVAMTRARDFLYLTYAADYGGVRIRKPSGFLSELKLAKLSYPDRRPLRPPPAVSGSLSPATPSLPIRGFKLKNLSYSQIDTFLACPLKYKYRYLYQIPAEPHHALSFGATIHNTLHQFHRYQQQGKTPSRSKLISLYKKNFLDFGYQSLAHKNERFRAGHLALTEYYRQFPALLGKPKMLEVSFRLRIDDLPFIGKIDRIDETDAGLEIVDYKTGEVETQSKVDQDRQLTIYALAAKEVYGLEIAKLGLYFVEKNLKITTHRSAKDLDKEKQFLVSLAKKIKTSQYSAKPGFPFPCSFCEYNPICPFALRK